MPRHAGLAIDMREQALHLAHASARGIRFARQQRRQRRPTGVIVGRADVRPPVLLLDQVDIGPVNRLADHVGIGARVRIHIGHRLQHHGVWQRSGKQGKCGYSWHKGSITSLIAF